MGWIGILLPFVLMFGVYFLFQGRIPQESISYYYHTGMGNVFVGALCAVALFLFFYSGYNQWDNWIGNIAGLFAIGVAWFPTTKTGPLDLSGIVHFGCATIFFLSLAVFSLFLFTKTNKKQEPTPRKRVRNTIFIACGIIMIACLAAIAVFVRFCKITHPQSSFVFWAESVALLAFGISWLTKGGTLYEDKKIVNLNSASGKK